MNAAQSALDRLRRSYASWPRGGAADKVFVGRFDAEVNQDLNLPRALAVLWELVRGDLPPAVRRATVDHFDTVLGLRLGEWTPHPHRIPAEVAALLAERLAARAEKDWAQADQLRDALRTLGWQVEDSDGEQRPSPLYPQPKQSRAFHPSTLSSCATATGPFHSGCADNKVTEAATDCRPALVP